MARVSLAVEQNNSLCITEFYNTTQYGSRYAIGKACRFLHGPKTDKRAIQRMDKAVQKQQEVSETMLQ